MRKEGRKRGISLCHQLINQEREGMKAVNDIIAESRANRMKSNRHDGQQYRDRTQALNNQYTIRDSCWQNPKITVSYRGNNHLETKKINEGDNASAEIILQQQAKSMKEQNKKEEHITVKRFDFSQKNQALNQNLFDIIGRSSKKIEGTVKTKNSPNCQEESFDKDKTANKNTFSVAKSSNLSERKIGKASTRKTAIAQEMEKRLFEIIKICSVKHDC